MFLYLYFSSSEWRGQQVIKLKSQRGKYRWQRRHSAAAAAVDGEAGGPESLWWSDEPGHGDVVTE